MAFEMIVLAVFAFMFRSYSRSIGAGALPGPVLYLLAYASCAWLGWYYPALVAVLLTTVLLMLYSFKIDRQRIAAERARREAAELKTPMPQVYRDR